MPDDGAWLNGSDFPPIGEARTARARFQNLLSEFMQRLAAPEPLRRETAVALVQQMERLARRMGDDERVLRGRAGDLSAALSALQARLETELAAAAAREAQLTAHLDRTLGELAEARAAKRPIFGPRAVKLVLAAAGLCAVLCASLVSITAFNRPQSIEAPASAAVVASDPPASPPLAEAAVVPIVSPVRPDSRPAPRAAALTRRTTDTFSMVSSALARGEPTALSRLNALAQAGDTRAQRQLASLYEAGDAGLGRDLAAARRWTLRAARGGDHVAMYNAAVFLMDGEGGPQDAREAGVWFRRAAERGVTDAQYNLGLMYETGRGVERSLSEARRWFALAAKAGDPAAAAKLSDSPSSSAPDVAPDGPSVAETQRYLAQQGYYIGAIDGIVSPALTAAAKAYVRDHPGSARGS